MLVALVLSVCGLVKGGKLDPSVKLRGSDLAQFVRLCEENRTVIEEIMKFELRGDFTSNPIRQLNSFLDAVGLRLVAMRRKKKAGKANYVYEFDRSKWDEMEKLATGYVGLEEVRRSLKEGTQNSTLRAAGCFKEKRCQ